MKSSGSRGEGLVKKGTYWVTNSRFIARELDRECTNKTGNKPWHRHEHLVDHRAHAARIYQPKLAAAILRGLREQLRAIGEMVIPRGIPPEAEEELEGYWEDVYQRWLDANYFAPHAPKN